MASRSSELESHKHRRQASNGFGARTYGNPLAKSYPPSTCQRTAPESPFDFPLTIKPEDGHILVYMWSGDLIKIAGIRRNLPILRGNA